MNLETGTNQGKRFSVDQKVPYKICVFVLLATMVLLALAVCVHAQEGLTGGSQAVDPGLLHGGYAKSWQLTHYSVKGVMTPVPAFALDNLLVCNFNGTGTWIYGEVDKDGTDTVKYDDFNWQLYGSQLFSRGHASAGEHGNLKMNIITLTAGELVVERLVPGTAGSPPEILRLALRTAVNPDPKASSRNRLLTQGLAKWWAVVEKKENGVVVEVEGWRYDDYLFFLTDGTGYATLGETEQLPGDTRNNDHFKWSFAENETVLRISEYDGEYANLRNSKIVRLEENLLVLEGSRVINGKDTLVTITFIPLLPPVR